MKIEWTVYARGDGAFIESDDFTHDVTLKVLGDFESVKQAVEYAQKLADKLNRAEGK